MKKLFAVVMTLLLVFSLPVFAMAEEATTAPETSAEEITAAPETAEDVTEEAAEPETDSETEPEIKFGFYPETALVTLPIMGMGMLGIFLVTLVIVLATVLLSKLGNKKKEG